MSALYQSLMGQNPVVAGQNAYGLSNRLDRQINDAQGTMYDATGGTTPAELDTSAMNNQQKSALLPMLQQKAKFADDNAP